MDRYQPPRPAEDARRRPKPTALGTVALPVSRSQWAENTRSSWPARDGPVRACALGGAKCRSFPFPYIVRERERSSNGSTIDRDQYVRNRLSGSPPGGRNARRAGIASLRSHGVEGRRTPWPMDSAFTRRPTVSANISASKSPGFIAVTWPAPAEKAGQRRGHRYFVGCRATAAGERRLREEEPVLARISPSPHCSIAPPAPTPPAPTPPFAPNSHQLS
jgi:hypothetical protein